MPGSFNPGEKLRTQFGQGTCTVEGFLGSGTQGEVYRAAIGHQSVAMKWYLPGQGGPLQLAIIRQLVEMRSPDEQRFLWPTDLVVSERMPGSFGYIMPLRDRRFKSIPEWLLRECSTTFWALLTAAINITDAFHALHAAGFVYRDINDNNVFFDPAAGDALICDNDNVGIKGQTMFNVIGTPGFMAPEVGAGRSEPNAESDLYSLSVLLFRLLIVHHPLVGKRVEAIKCKDPAADKYIYIDRPLFVHDPDDRSNAPDPGLHPNAIVFWNLYPQVIRDCFIEAFTKGLKHPQQRIWEATWKKKLFAARDATFPCQRCHEDNFYDRSAVNAQAECWSCRKPLVLPPRLRIGGNTLVMLHGRTCLYAFHLGLPEHRHHGPVAEIRQHPTRPGVLGLKNLTKTPWRIESGSVAGTEVPPGGSVTVADRLRLLFHSGVRGEVRT